MKISKKVLILTLLLILSPMLFGIINWSSLPNEIPIHWNLRGDVDRYASKEMAVYIMPIALCLLQLAMAASFSIDPRKRNHSKKITNSTLWIIPIMSFVVSFSIYGTALNYAINTLRIATLMLGFLFVLIGNYMPKAKQNYTIGIKIPWTLNDETNWYKTHKLAGTIWVVSGFMMIICALVELYIIAIVFAFLSAIIPIVYSYTIYKEEKEDTNK